MRGRWYGVLAASMAAGALSGGTPAYAATVHGCPSGAFCVYPSSTGFSGGPTYRFYSYGAHNIHSQYGYHYVYNNQYEVNGHVAGATFCTKPNGKGDTDLAVNRDQHAARVNLTPVNSIDLWLNTTAYDASKYCNL